MPRKRHDGRAPCVNTHARRGFGLRGCLGAPLLWRLSPVRHRPELGERVPVLQGEFAPIAAVQWTDSRE